MVGGGPAGSATALRLARAGVGVTLLERARFPRRKVCGEYQNCGAVAALDELGLGERVRASASEIRGIRLAAASAPPVELPFSRPALACDRSTLDSLLLGAAATAGVEVVRGRVDTLIFDGVRAAGVTYRDERGDRVTRRARFVVGADGAGSVVARKLGLTVPLPKARRFAIGGHFGGFGDLDGFIEMYVGAGAYFAINPLDSARANVMLVVPHSAFDRWTDVDAGVNVKAAELSGGRRSLLGVERIGERVSTGPLAHRVRTPVAAGALLAGDAAGFLNPFTGQGVYLALEGAKAASAAVLQALADRTAETRAFATYASARERDYRIRATLCALLGLLADRAPLARRVATRLERYPAARRALMDAISGVGSPARGLRAGLLSRILS